MAGQDEALVLAARVVDGFSKPLADMRRSLRAVAAETGQFHKQSITQSKAHTVAFDDLRKSVIAVGDNVRGTLTPALAAMGISALSVAAGLKAIKDAITDFSDSARSLTFLNRQTGFAVDQLRELQALAPRIGSSAEAMSKGLANFADHMERLGRSPRLELFESFKSLNVMPVGPVVQEWTNLIRSMQGLGRGEQLEKVLQFVDKIRDPSQKRGVLKAFGLDEALANLNSPERRAALADIRKNLGSLSDDARKKGLEAAEGFDKLRESIERLRTEVGANLAGDVAKATTSIAEFISGRGPELTKTLGEMAKGAADFVRGAGLMGEALDSLRKQDPVDLTKLVDFAGFDKTGEVFMATWKARWLSFKSNFGGDQGAADAAEVERRRLLKQDFPEEFEREEKGRRNEQERGLQGGLPFAPRWPVPQIDRERIMPPPGTGPGGQTTKPLWRRLFDMSDAGGGATPVSYTAQGGVNPLLGGGGLSPSTSEAGRMISQAVERGTFAGLVDYAHQMQPGGGGGGGGGGAGGGMAAIRAAYSPGGGGGFGGAGAGTGAGGDGGGAGGAGRPGSAPMGGLPGADGKPVGVTSIDGGAGPGKPPGQNVEGPAGTPSRGDPRGLTDFIRSNAAKYNLNPNAMVKAWQSEGLRDSFGASGRRENSWGATQLHYPGLANEFERDTGLKANDPKNERAMIDWSHAYIARHPNAFDRGRGGKWFGPGNRYGAQAAHAMAQHADAVGGGKAPHFSVGDIRKSLEGTAAAADVPRTGSGAFRDLPSAPGYRPELASIDPKLREILAAGKEQFEARHPGYSVNATSGRRYGPGQGPHASQSGAIDTQIIGPKGPLPNSGRDTSGLYTEYARLNYGEMLARHPEMAKRFNWGGYFESSKGSGRADLMHFDFEGYKPYRQGITEQYKRLGAVPGVAYGPHEDAKTAEKSLHGAALREHFGHRGAKPGAGFSGDLLGEGRRAGFVGQPQEHKVSGSASLSVDFKNMPKGVEARPGKMAGMFRELKINRGRAAGTASQDG